jgi:CubicO group peptidase (beta-lactamase class C family)
MSMARRQRGVVAISALLVLLSAAPAPSQDIDSKVEEYMRARVERDHFSGAVLVARDGKPLVRQGYGMANLEHDVPNAPNVKFRLGSITKQFTAMAVMILQEKGKLDVREKVKTYLPDSPKAWDEVTVHHLLTHTSGIPSFTSFPDYLASMPVHVTLDQLVARFKDKPLEFKPGEKFKYSNSGYVLLGKLIDKVSGRTYPEFLQKNIFEPLGMKDTGYDNPIPVLKHRASGYSRPFLLNLNASYLDMSIPHAAGALYSTVDDLLLWDQALYTEKLVSKATLEKIFTPFKNHYAYGWTVGKEFGRKMVGHGGGINGFATDIRRYPDDRICVVVLSNLDSAPVGAIGHDLAAIAFGEKYSIPGRRLEAKVDPKLFDDYAGRYEADEPKVTVTVTREGDRLMARLTGQPKLQLFPESETSFFDKAVDARVEFIKDKSGKVTHLVIHQGGVDLKARRREAGAKPEPGKAP